ncbi:MAG: glycosyltransferase [Candidatus Nanopelagicales bacterium]|nr:glycosyltransferase [Candidatus Nanopelagicales bacterium]MDZ4248499.1 glycosyltransferase [Candidatus Nanopelagicales bacterium]
MTTSAGAGFRPLLCADLELSNPSQPHGVPVGAGLHLTVRLHSEPLGGLLVEPDRVPAGPDAWREDACGMFGDEIAEHVRADEIECADDLVTACRAPISACARRLDIVGPAPSAIVVVCTLGQHPMLPASIRALLAQDYVGDFSVVVVDNAPSSGAAARVVAEIADTRLLLLPAHRVGLSFARNAALWSALAADVDLIAYTDDDAIVDLGWLRSTAATFSEDLGVTSVTGLVLPGSLLSEAEQLFEEGSGFTKGYKRTVWSTATTDSSVWRLGPQGDGGGLFPFSAGLFGSGNSMAFRTEALRALGGFDEALGAGTPAGGGEDLDMFLRVIASGGTIVYEPRAMVRHFHRQSVDALSQQMSAYGSGLSAYLFREFLHLRGAKLRLLRVVPRGIRRMFSLNSEKNQSRTNEYPRELVRAERRGFVAGPWLYLKSRRRVRKLARTADIQAP